MPSLLSASPARSTAYLLCIAGMGGLLYGIDVGIIAGEVAINPVFGKVLAGKNDGAVTVESAKLEGMHDFVVVPYSHTIMLWRDEVIQQALAFLREGKFSHPQQPANPTKP